ncbi:MAG: hypothetical protein J5601_07275, partial [Elusimicrobiaceae bacterium]|nr:hypothetical protein [Elusimicrobiaceae bacterium]
MNNIKNLIRLTVVKAAQAALVTAFIFAAVVPAHAQTADVRYAGVFYKNNPSNVKGMYCDYSGKFGTCSSDGNIDYLNSILHVVQVGTTNLDGDFYITGADYPASQYCPTASQRVPGGSYQNGDYYWIDYNGRQYCIQLVSSTTSPTGNASTLSNDDFIAQVVFISIFSYFPGNSDGQLSLTYTGTSCPGASARIPGGTYEIGETYHVLDSAGVRRCFQVLDAPMQDNLQVKEYSPENRSFVYTPTPTSSHNDNDPWVSSALI